VLGKAVAAAEKQSEASGALKEAADALAEDEEVSGELISCLRPPVYFVMHSQSFCPT
jgi:hypothetical protein